MTIHDPDGFMKNFWDWGFLDECFEGSNCKVSDVDGEVERYGKFLVIETKSPGASIPKGQQILLDAKQKRGDLVVVVWGERNKPEMMQIWGHHEKPVPTDIQKLKDVVRWWWRRANKSKGAR